MEESENKQRWMDAIRAIIDEYRNGYVVHTHDKCGICAVAKDNAYDYSTYCGCEKCVLKHVRVVNENIRSATLRSCLDMETYPRDNYRTANPSSWEIQRRELRAAFWSRALEIFAALPDSRFHLRNIIGSSEPFPELWKLDAEMSAKPAATQLQSLLPLIVVEYRDRDWAVHYEHEDKSFGGLPESITVSTAFDMKDNPVVKVTIEMCEDGQFSAVRNVNSDMLDTDHNGFSTPDVAALIDFVTDWMVHAESIARDHVAKW